MNTSRAGEPWTKDEDESLKIRLLAGLKLDFIAAMHKRTTGAIIARVEKYLSSLIVIEDPCGDAAAIAAAEYWKGKFDHAVVELQEYNAANNLLLERINLDLNPRIKELALKVHMSKGLQDKHTNQRITIGAMQERERVLVKRLAEQGEANDELHHRLDKIHEECIR